MNHWQQRFIGLAQHVAGWSKDPSTKVGAVIVDNCNRIVSLGFNGPPAHTDDTKITTRDVKLMRTIHAEANAILFARRDLVGDTLYVTHHPCAHCAALIIQAGISFVYYPPISAAFIERWYADITQAKTMFDEAGVTYGTIRGS